MTDRLLCSQLKQTEEAMNYQDKMKFKIQAGKIQYQEMMESGEFIEYNGYIIKPKMDFGSYGYYIAGVSNIKHGFVVSKDGCNPMPGATWALTINQAKNMIDDYIEADGDAKVFWALNRERKQEEINKCESEINQGMNI